jgi:hypothetical protein
MEAAQVSTAVTPVAALRQAGSAVQRGSFIRSQPLQQQQQRGQVCAVGSA